MKHRVLTISRDPSNNPKYPFIRISGKWVLDTGFPIGGRVLVEYKKGDIRIRAINLVTDDDEEKTDDRGQTTEDRGEKKARAGEQRTEYRKQTTEEKIDDSEKIDDRGQMTDDR